MTEIHNYLLQEMELINKKNLHFQQDGSSAHNYSDIYQIVSTIVIHQWIESHGLIQWPPISSDLYPVDYFCEVKTRFTGKGTETMEL